ncbi:menaquinone biosynthesis protein [Blastopirellula sp. JC732]|uniref:Chorismate dehydratase n=1 Tax=Blastopirellula sediminis TaxID=2894196 RepID=A0A9X1MM95_9BACT|nr:menaquinone biosynthesis protein [Blastopirellula sediminis]MCC9609139.1 menaquinone biosynthesis protein [Blastopirellula sediminis]MCC9628084.1 menaquinone biosynthesis protein [Blastopirellula sediminis]
MHSDSTIRVGAVSYLNTKPLVYGLAAANSDIELVFDLPSRLADQLAAGDLDVALIPSVEFFQDPSYSIVSDACIACRGPVWSVKLFFRKPPAEVRTLALDEGSRTSAALSKILLSERFGLMPQTVPLPIDSRFDSVDADAVLIIGDRAIHAPSGEFVEIWDLGQVWREWSGKPFVFAAWVARPGFDTPQIAAALSAARDAGLAQLEEIAAAEAPRHRLTTEQCLTYLRDNLHFNLGPDEESGLALFHRHAVQRGLAPPNDRWTRHDCEAT